MLSRLYPGMARILEEDASIIDKISEQLQLIADITNSDVFIDCILPYENVAIVVAQARPMSGESLYRQDIVGQTALPENEPAVFQTYSSGMPIRDIKAITQENRTVKQDVVPIYGCRGKVIAVLIREKDISDAILLNKKYEELAKRCEEENNMVLPPEDITSVAIRATHHWVKNNLQLIASRMNIESRRCDNLTAQNILRENAARVLSITSIHDIIAKNNNEDTYVSSKMLFENFCQNMKAFIPEGKSIELLTAGDEIKLKSEHTTAVLVIISELVINAIKYAFAGKDSGFISIVSKSGKLYSTIYVQDNGIGFDPFARRYDACGLEIVSSTVREKLKGKLHINSGDQGTKVIFDFKN